MKIPYRSSKDSELVAKTATDLSLNTVCVEANCPNLMECFAKKTATFMIMGNLCTRNCHFCNVTCKKPLPLDSNEPGQVAKAVQRLGLSYVVITSVDRDDLEDGGAEHFAQVIKAIHNSSPQCKIEVLIPDFRGEKKAIERVLAAKPDVVNHNIETVEEIFDRICPQCDFDQSLELLRYVKDRGFKSKSGFMVGLGETDEQVYKLLAQLRQVGCDFVTIGQYLQPTRKHHPIDRYVHPDRFEAYRQEALGLGFSNVESGPFVRSSYYAEQMNEKS